MNRIQKTFTLLAVLAIPAGAQISAPSTEKLCFASGTATFQLAPSAAAPDYRIRIERDLTVADLRMRLVDRLEIADFVLVDDFSGTEQDACNSSTRVQTVKLDPAAEKPDVLVNLSAEPGPAELRIYVRSVRFSHQDAAALLAAMWKAEQKRKALVLVDR